jgi:hypothetical protein
VAIAQALWGISNAVLTVMVVGLVAFTRRAVAIRRRAAFRRSDLRRSDPATRRILTGLRAIGVLEALLVLGAVWSCNYFDRGDLLLPAIALAVSIHFAPVAHLMGVPLYYLTAAAGTLVSSAVMLLPLASSRPTWLGTGMAVVMWATALYLLSQADAVAAASVASSREEIKT